MSASAEVVVAGALIVNGTVLVAQRDRPPELAGRWELPGGKVGPGEDDAGALIRELAEELGIDVRVGPRLGADVALSKTTTLRAYLVTQTCDGVAHAHDHRALYWAAAAELQRLDWVPADRAWLPELLRLLADPTCLG
ncbi:MAG TPA: NUDIX domain-containing protein [Mycobacterium sp.]|nr:NUDIX domain-containing protein [Mycobacterium sp.]